MCVCVFRKKFIVEGEVEKGMVKVFSSLKHLSRLYELYTDMWCECII